MTVDAGLFVLRLVIGLLFIGHGAQKLFGWFGGPGIEGTTQWLGSLGLRPARFWAIVAGLGEFLGGIGLVLGFLTPLASAAIIAVMLSAIALVHAQNGLWVTNGGAEYPIVMIAAAYVIGMLGPGRYALDAYLPFALPVTELFLTGAVAAILVTLAELAIIRQQRRIGQTAAAA
jgi:putative oxidoreductase